MKNNQLSLPLCYRFSFDVETMTLFLKIQKWMIPEIQELFTAETRLMEYMYKTYKGDKTLFANFGKKNCAFGWNDSIIWNSENDEEIIYSYTLVPIIKPTDEVCERCKGTKIDYFDHPCHECRATGKKHISSEKHFSECLLSLYPVIRFANGALLDFCIEKGEHKWKPSTDKKQMVAIEWSDTTGMHNCSINSWVDEDVLVWVKEVPNSETKSITFSMKKTEETLLLDQVSEFGFRFEMYSDSLFGFQVPGNACTLGMSSHGMGMFGNIGKTLYPHNVDNRFQQMEFIVGLAVMSDLAY